MHTKSTSFFLAGILLATSSLSEAKTEKTTSASRPLIERSVIIAPKHVGHYNLVKLDYDPKTKFAGATIRYQNPDHPGINFDLFVYPLGRGDEAQSVKLGMAGFRESLNSARDSGFFTSLQIGAETDFVVEEGASQKTNSTDAAKPKPDEAKDGKAAVANDDKDMKELFAEGAKIRGRKLVLTYGVNEMNLDSRGLLFYHQLYLTKVRISIPVGGIATADFDAIVDDAARALVPAIEVRNTGGCLNTAIGISMPKEGQSDADSIHDMTMQILSSAMRYANENCQEDLKISKITGNFEYAQIEYNAEDWAD